MCEVFIALLILAACSGESQSDQAGESEAAAKPAELRPAPIAQIVRDNLEQSLQEALALIQPEK